VGKSIRSFAGSRLTFLKLGSTSASFGGWVLNESQDSHILAFQCGREFLTYSTEFNACHDKSIRSFLTCSVYLLMVGSECVGDLVVIWLPPYSPDLNPIEFVFSYVKSYLRCHDALLQAIDDPSPAIKAAFESVTKQHCQCWITNSGYIR